MKADDKTKVLEIFDGTLFQAEMVKNLLENEGIEAFLKDQIIGTRSSVWATTGGVKVMVSSLDINQALQIVKEYESLANPKHT